MLFSQSVSSASKIRCWRISRPFALQAWNVFCVSIERSDSLCERDTFPLQDVIGKDVDQKFQSLYFRAQGQNGLPFVQIRNKLRKLKTELRPFETRLDNHARLFYVAQSLVACDRFPAQRERHFTCFFVVEIFHSGPQI